MSSSFRRRPVSFGNPSLEAYQGIVYTSAAANVARQEEEEPVVIEGALPISYNESWVALTDVPPDQVPEGVLHLVRSHRPWIKHLRVVIADQNEAAASMIPKSSSIAESAASLLKASEEAETGVEEEHERNYIVLMELTTAESARLIVEDLDGQPFTSLDETQVGHLERKFAPQSRLSTEFTPLRPAFPHIRF